MLSIRYLIGPAKASVGKRRFGGVQRGQRRAQQVCKGDEGEFHVC